MKRFLVSYQVGVPGRAMTTHDAVSEETLEKEFLARYESSDKMLVEPIRNLQVGEFVTSAEGIVCRLKDDEELPCSFCNIGQGKNVHFPTKADLINHMKNEHPSE